LLVNSWEG